MLGCLFLIIILDMASKLVLSSEDYLATDEQKLDYEATTVEYEYEEAVSTVAGNTIEESSDNLLKSRDLGSEDANHAGHKSWQIKPISNRYFNLSEFDFLIDDANDKLDSNKTKRKEIKIDWNKVHQVLDGFNQRQLEEQDEYLKDMIKNIPTINYDDLFSRSPITTGNKVRTIRVPILLFLKLAILFIVLLIAPVIVAFKFCKNKSLLSQNKESDGLQNQHINHKNAQVV